MIIPGYLRIAFGFVLVTLIICVLLVLVTNNRNKTQVAASQQPNVVVSVTPAIPTVTPTQITSAAPITFEATATPQIVPGQPISLPYSSLLGVKAVQPSDLPLHSSDIALQTLRAHLNLVEYWDLKNSTSDGRPITVTTTFGLVTEGYRGPDGGWGGMVNIPLRDCTIAAVCTDTGKKLDHLENRPMWLIDIEGVSLPSAGGSNAKKTNHVVYGIDDLNLDMYGFGAY